MSLEALHHAVLLLLAPLRVVDPVGQVDARAGAIAAKPTMRPAQPGDRADVAADAGRVLAVEDDLGGHRAEHVDQRGRTSPSASRRSAPRSPSPGGGRRRSRACGSTAASTAGSRCRGASRPRGRPRGSRSRAPRAAGSPARSRRPASTVVIASTMSSQVERGAAVGVRVGQRHRADLVDHRRRVAGGDARELVALLLRVELRVVRDLRDVEVEDVAPVLPRRRAEVDVAAHPARARERGVERLERHVAGADEVDLLLARPRRLLAQPHRADPLRDDVERVEERVEAVRDERAWSAAGRRCRPSRRAAG